MPGTRNAVNWCKRRNGISAFCGIISADKNWYGVERLTKVILFLYTGECIFNFSVYHQHSKLGCKYISIYMVCRIKTLIALNLLDLKIYIVFAVYSIPVVPLDII